MERILVKQQVIQVYFSTMLVRRAPVHTREAGMIKLHEQEVFHHLRFLSDVCYKHCSLLSQLLKMAATFACEIFEEI